MTVLGTDTFRVPWFIKEGVGIELRQDGVSQALEIGLKGTAASDTELILLIGASNAWGNELADTGDKTVTGDWKVWNYDTSAFVTPALGSNPFRPATPPYSAPNNWGFQYCNLRSAAGKEVLFVHLAKPSTNFLQWTAVGYGGVNSSLNNFDADTIAGTIPKVQNVMTAVMASSQVRAAGLTKATKVLLDLGGIDTLVGQDELNSRIRAITGSLRAQSWCGATTPIIAVEMPPRGSYGDVTTALNRYFTSAADPYFGLVSLEGVPFTIDDYPSAGDVAHYAGRGMATVASRAQDMYNKLPVAHLGTGKNVGAGLGVILSTDASNGSVPGESRTVPYVASCSDDGTVYTLSTPAATRPISYIEVSATNAPRNVKTTFHNYRSDGAVLCLMAPRKPAINITNISVGAGPNYFVTVTYDGTIDDSDPDYFARGYISGVGGATQANNRYFEIVSLDTVNKTFVLQNAEGVYTSGQSWGAYTSGGTFEQLIAFEDPRTRNRFANEVYIFENESVTYERLGGGATAPFRVVEFTPHPEYQTFQDLYRPNNQVLNGDFRMLETGWSTSTRSDTTWTIGAADSGRFPGSRAMILEDRSGVANNLLWSYRRRVREGDSIFARCQVIAEDTVSPASALAISASRLYFQYFDADGVQVGSDVAGVSDTSARADWTALEIFDEVPADAVEATAYLRTTMTGGTFKVTDFELGLIETKIDGRHYATRAEFVTAVAEGLVRANGLITKAGGLEYKWQSGATAISDLQGLVPNGPIEAAHFGDLGTASTNAGIIQAAIDYAETLGLEVGLPAAVTLIQSTLTIQQGMKLTCRAGNIASASPPNLANATATLTWNSASASPMILVKAATSGHRVYGAEISNIILDGANVATHGILAESPMKCIFDGVSYRTTSRGIEINDNNSSLANQNIIRKWEHFCGPTTAAWGASGIVIDGDYTNNFATSTLIEWAECEFVNGDGIMIRSHDSATILRAKPYMRGITSTITGITQANPAVVTYSGLDVILNGMTVTISGVAGMTQVNGNTYTVANVNTTANTFELSGVNSTGFGAYTSGGSMTVKGTGYAVAFRKSVNYPTFHCQKNIINHLYATGTIYVGDFCKNNVINILTSEGGSITYESSGSDKRGLHINHLSDFRTSEPWATHKFKLSYRHPIPITAAAAKGTTPTVSTIGSTGIGYCWSFSASATNGLMWSGLLDDNCYNGTIKGVRLVLQSVGSATGNTVWTISCDITEIGASPGTMDATKNFTLAPAQSVSATMTEHECLFDTPISFTGRGSVYVLSVERLGADAADTFTNAVILVGVELLYVGAGPSSSGYGPYPEPVVIDAANP